MKKNRFAIVIATFLVAGSATVQAQFSGSDGSDGAINITTDTTLTLPPDGIFNATTINVAATMTLTFTTNGNNTPVYLLATGDIVVDGTISVSGTQGTASTGGLGGPGGFDGGVPAFGGDPPGDGYGPGAGHQGGTGNGGHASYGGVGNANSLNGAVYGSPLLVPLVGGSGGGGSTGTNGGGGGGGGAVMLASDTRVVINGLVAARGRIHAGISSPGMGSGGAIRIVAPTVEGTGEVNVTGGASGGWFGGHGRIRFDLIDRTGVGNLTRTPVAAEAVGAFMTAFVPNFPKLDIIEVAGTTVLEGSGPVDIILPFGTLATQTIIVQGRDFTGLVPIRIILTPDSGDPVVLDTNIDMIGGNPSTVSVMMDFPLNVRTTVNAWTR